MASSCQTQPAGAKGHFQNEPSAQIAADAHKGAAAPSSSVTRWAPFPPRSEAAEGGHAFLARTAHLSAAKREEAILREVLAGNVPSHLRHFVPVELETRTASGKKITATAWVLPDYLAIGDDDDFVRVPINLFTASRIADALGLAMPTQKLVNAIYAQADVHLTPQPLPAGPSMSSNRYVMMHNDMIEEQLADTVDPEEDTLQLIAGHKKDVVITKKLARIPDRIAIYGWHRRDSRPIQPLSAVHGARYADYSHGLRFLSPILDVGGKQVAIEQVLTDPRLSSLLSNEGSIAHYAELMHPGGMPRKSATRLAGDSAPISGLGR